MTIEKLLDRGEEFARMMMGDEGMVPSAIHFMYRKNGDPNAFGLIGYEAPRHQPQRRQLALAIGQQIRAMGATAYAVVNEVWYADHDPNEDDPRPPSQCDDRREGVFITAYDSRGRHVVRMFSTDRTKNPIRLSRVYGLGDKLFDNTYAGLLSEGAV